MEKNIEVFDKNRKRSKNIEKHRKTSNFCSIIVYIPDKEWRECTL